jgi:ABC-type phosphate/phosphonate transport system substrate-binding protein
VRDSQNLSEQHNRSGHGNESDREPARRGGAVNWTVSLPMYNLPKMRAVNARFWEALRVLLIDAGLDDLPASLSFERPPVPGRIGREVLFSQTCGYPLGTIFRGQAIRVGTPCYTVPGCDGPTHCGFFIVPAAARTRELRDLRGGVFLLNHRHSNSGMNLPRRSLAEIAGGRPFFAHVVETGSQPGNLDRIARGEADATCVDCVTYSFWRRYRAEAARHVRVLASTRPSPAIPFVTSVATPALGVEALRAALRVIASETRYAALRYDLLLDDIRDVPDAAYRGLLDYENKAAELGYPELL